MVVVGPKRTTYNNPSLLRTSIQSCQHRKRTTKHVKLRVYFWHELVVKIRNLPKPTWQLCLIIEKLNETYLKSKFDWNSMSHSKERRNNVR